MDLQGIPAAVRAPCVCSRNNGRAREAATRAQRLRDEIERANHSYYVLDAPAIPDAEYDRLFRSSRTWRPNTPSWSRRIADANAWAGARWINSSQCGTR